MIYDCIEDGSISRWQGNYHQDLIDIIFVLKKMTNSLLEEYLNKSDPMIEEAAIVVENNWLICPKCLDAWISDSLTPMVICPKCEHALHNPRTS